MWLSQGKWRLAGLVFYTYILRMLTKRLTKIGDSTGLVIDKPILDLLGLARGDEVELRIEDERLIVGPVEVSARAERHRAKFAKAKARVHANVGTALQKLAK
jgi:antitoxin component of MazEF toxin-antitoxin module